MKKRTNCNDFLLIVLNIFLVTIICFPILFDFYMSMQKPSAILSYPPKFIIHDITLKNYIEVLKLTSLLRFILNSFVVASISSLLQVTLSCMCAFAFVFYKNKLRDILFILVLSTIMVPAQTIFIGNYMMIRQMGLLNTYLALILPNAVSAFGIFFMRQYFKSIPIEFFEAAKVEGCSNINYLIKILIPLSKPAIGSFMIYSFINIWNQYMWPLLVTDTDKIRTVQIGISMLQSAEQQNIGLIAAGVIIVIIPTFVVFLFGHNQLVKGLTAGAIKG